MYTRTEMTQRGLAWAPRKDDTHWWSKCSIYCAVPRGCLMLCWLTPRKWYESKQHVASDVETVIFFTTEKEKLIPNSSQCLLCSTKSGRSCLSHSFPVILCGIYCPAAILVFLLVPKIPDMPDLCMVHSLPLLRSLLQCYQRPFLTTLSDTIPPQCVLLSSLSLCFLFFFFCTNYFRQTVSPARMWTIISPPECELRKARNFVLITRIWNTACYIAGA